MEKEKKKITIVDVAEKAGVSKTTISRYLNGKYEYMSAESRERIGEVIAELGYRPNNLARSLKSKYSKMLGVVVSDITSPFSPILLKGISDCCEHYGYRILIADSSDRPQKEQEYILSMLDQRVDGIILNTTGKNLEFLRELKERDVPFVLADRSLEEPLFDTVRTADRQIIFQVLRHLQAVGYERVGFFTEPLANSTREHRYEAFGDACREIFAVAARDYFLTEQADAADLLQEFLQESKGKKRAVFTANGVVTMKMLRAMQAQSVSFPADVGICGFDDWEWMSLVKGGITAVAQPTYQVGRECVKRMMYRLHRSKAAPVRNIELPCEFIVRQSI